MTVDRAQLPGETRSSTAVTTADLIDALVRFDGPPEQFLTNLLAVQCRIAAASAGAILRPGPQGRPELVAVFPPLRPGETAPVWLAEAVESAPAVATSGRTAVKPLVAPDELYGQPSSRHIALLPLRGERQVRGLAAFLLEGRDAQSVEVSRERLEITISLLSLYEMRLTLQRRQSDMRRLRLGLETLTAVHEQPRFLSASMALCNEVASRWSADRVSLGFLKGRSVHLKAASHTEKFSRKMQLVQDIESAMEECLDQDVEVLYPAGPDSTTVNRTTGELATKHGPMTVVSLPLRRNGEPVGVLTVERAADQPFHLEEVEALRLLCELSTPWVANLHERDRWFGARWAGSSRKTLAMLVGPKHTWIKVASIAIAGLLAFVLLAEGTYRVSPDFTVEAVEKRVVAAPFAGKLATVAFDRPGLPVKAGDVLATIETEDLQLEMLALQAEQNQYEKQAAAALRDGKLGEVEVARAMAAKTQARIDLAQRQIEQATLTAPIDGTIVAGELKQQIGTALEAGQTLFELAPLQALRAELLVPEDDIAEVRPGQSGKLATKTYPGRRIGFVVESINPVAEVVDQKNVFKVRVRLEERPEWLAPGMEGTAKVEIDQRTYAWIWTHKLVDWVRMKLWI